jgi:hypothetical protein
VVAKVIVAVAMLVTVKVALEITVVMVII